MATYIANLAKGVDYPETQDPRAPETPLRFKRDRECPPTPKKPKSLAHGRLTLAAKRLNFEEDEEEETSHTYQALTILLLVMMYYLASMLF